MKPMLVQRVASMNFQEADKDKSGSISMEEFLEIYSKMMKQ